MESSVRWLCWSREEVPWKRAGPSFKVVLLKASVLKNLYYGPIMTDANSRTQVLEIGNFWVG